jgi:hypothetical protein
MSIICRSSIQIFNVRDIRSVWVKIPLKLRSARSLKLRRGSCSEVHHFGVKRKWGEVKGKTLNPEVLEPRRPKE